MSETPKTRSTSRPVTSPPSSRRTSRSFTSAAIAVREGQGEDVAHRGAEETPRGVRRTSTYGCSVVPLCNVLAEVVPGHGITPSDACTSVRHAAAESEQLLSSSLPILRAVADLLSQKTAKRLLEDNGWT